MYSLNATTTIKNQQLGRGKGQNTVGSTNGLYFFKLTSSVRLLKGNAFFKKICSFNSKHQQLLRGNFQTNEIFLGLTTYNEYAKLKPIRKTIIITLSNKDTKKGKNNLLFLLFFCLIHLKTIEEEANKQHWARRILCPSSSQCAPIYPYTVH